MKGKLKFISRNNITSDIWQLHFDRPEKFDWTAGQFVEVNIPNDSPDDRGTTRWFTISSSPSEKDIVITTRHVKNHPSTFKNDLFNLSKGDEIGFKGPDGKFVLPESDSKILWIAGGIGITPFISQIQYLLDKEDDSKEIELIWGLRSLDENPCAELIKLAGQKLHNLNVNIVLSDVIPSDWQGKSGLIDVTMIEELAPDFKTRETYISGPEPMVDALKERLLENGQKDEHIHGDWFPGYHEKY